MCCGKPLEALQDPGRGLFLAGVGSHGSLLRGCWRAGPATPSAGPELRGALGQCPGAGLSHSGEDGPAGSTSVPLVQKEALRPSWENCLTESPIQLWGEGRTGSEAWSSELPAKPHLSCQSPCAPWMGVTWQQAGCYQPWK